jgi:hypothetical protein
MYSITTLRSPSPSRLSRAAGVRPVFNPPSRPSYAPANAPLGYDQQIGQLRSGNVTPNFVTPNSADSGGGGAGGEIPPAAFGFSNSNNPAFAGQSLPSPGASSVSGPAGTVAVDYASDPILQQARSLYESQVAQAESGALGAEKTALIRYGDPKLVAQVLGDDAGDTSQAAGANSFSTVAELGRWNDRSLSGIDTTANRSNLYFSSTRARDRGLQEEDMTRQSARTANQLQDVLTNIAQGLLSARQGAMSSYMGSAESAYSRALQEALTQAYYMPPMAPQTAAAPQSAGSPGVIPSTSPYIANTPSLVPGSGTSPRIWY